MQPSSVSIALAGSGGSGVMTTGELLLDAVARDGGYGLLTRSFGPQIRGGESAALLRLSGAPVANPGDIFDLLVALDWLNVDRFADEIPLGPSSVVIADPDRGEVPESIRASGTRIVPVPLKALAAEADKSRANMVALGLVAALAGIGDTALRAAIDRRLTAKGDAVLATAHATVAIGTRTAGQVRDLPRFNVSGRDGERWNLAVALPHLPTRADGLQAARACRVRAHRRPYRGLPPTPGRRPLHYRPAVPGPGHDGDTASLGPAETGGSGRKFPGPPRVT